MTNQRIDQRIVPCLWLDDQAEALAAMYTTLFGGRVIATSHYPASGTNPARKAPGSVLTIELEAAGFRLTALNGGPQFRLNPSISLFALARTPADVDRWFATLAEGGSVLMPLDAYPWSPRYAWVQDRFGVSWQLMAGDALASTQTIMPCLMFANAQHRRAEEAMQHYTRVLPNGRIGMVDRYGDTEGAPGAIKHGRIEIDGVTLAAMDSHIEHAFSFNEALSLQVMSESQAEIDRLWDALPAGGGSTGPCGWLTDRFGVSWQVVPKNIATWLTSPDVVARDRAFAAMMTMTKLDVGAIERAFAGR